MCLENRRRLRMGSGRSLQHGDLGAVQLGRPVAHGRRARRHRQGRRQAVRGARVPRRRPAAGENKSDSLGGVRVLGRPGARHESL